MNDVQKIREAIQVGATYTFECYKPRWISIPEDPKWLLDREAAGRPVKIVELDADAGRALVPVDQAEYLAETFPFVELLEGGEKRWEDGFENLMVDEGLEDVLTEYFKGSSYTASHAVGLKGSGSPAAGDTMSSHAGWSEVTAYDEANRPTFTPGTVSSKSVDNSASVAQFTISTNGTSISGAFVSTDNTKGGTSGTLVSAGDFASAKSADDGDLVKVTVTFNAQDV